MGPVHKSPSLALAKGRTGIGGDVPDDLDMVTSAEVTDSSQYVKDVPVPTDSKTLTINSVSSTSIDHVFKKANIFF